MAGVCAFLNLYAPQPVLPLLARFFGVGAGKISLIVSAATLGVALGAPFVGIVADRIGRRRVIVISLFGLGISTMLTAVAPTLSLVIAFRFMTGIFTPGIIASILAYIAEEWPSSGAAKTTARYVSATVLGGFIGRFLTGCLGEHGLWRLSFLILGFVTVIGSIVVQRWMPASRNFVRVSSWRKSLSDFAGHLRNPILLSAYAVGFSVLFSLVATFTYITFHLAGAPYFLSPAGQGMLFFVYLIGLVITPMSGPWIQRIGHNRVVPLAIGCSISGVLLTLSGPFILVIAGLALCCSGVFVCQAASSGYVGLCAKRSRSAATGLYVTFYYLGGCVGSTIPGIIWKDVGWAGCVAMIVCVQLVAGAISFFLWKPVDRSSLQAERQSRMAH
jgi:predicted MFS family arabinose efflux permease